MHVRLFRTLKRANRIMDFVNDFDATVCDDLMKCKPAVAISLYNRHAAALFYLIGYSRVTTVLSRVGPQLQQSKTFERWRADDAWHSYRRRTFSNMTGGSTEIPYLVLLGALLTAGIVFVLGSSFAVKQNKQPAPPARRTLIHRSLVYLPKYEEFLTYKSPTHKRDLTYGTYGLFETPMPCTDKDVIDTINQALKPMYVVMSLRRCTNINVPRVGPVYVYVCETNKPVLRGDYGTATYNLMIWDDASASVNTNVSLCDEHLTATLKTALVSDDFVRKMKHFDHKFENKYDKEFRF